MNWIDIVCYLVAAFAVVRAGQAYKLARATAAKLEATDYLAREFHEKRITDLENAGKRHS